MYKPYTGNYEKEWYAIKTKDGREFKSCWPNGGVFNCINPKNPDAKMILVDEKDVLEYDIGIHPMDITNA
jgi:hypothetical protein